MMLSQSHLKHNLYTLNYTARVAVIARQAIQLTESLQLSTHHTFKKNIINSNVLIHSGNLKYVQLGQHDINSDTSDVDVQHFIVNETYVHPDFQYLSVYNDIGLVELDKPAEFTQFISPACLPVQSNFDDTHLETVGYGLLQLREKLGKHPVQFSPIEDCKEIYASNSLIRSDNVEPICSKVLGENDECYVDVGGPLQLINTRYEFGNFTEIVGVYLFGSTCGSECRDIYKNVKYRKYSSTGFIGGWNSIAKEHPHMALLGFGEPDNIQWLCGGALISLEFVLTAAHCLFSKINGDVKYVRVGELDISSTTDDADPQDFTIKKIYPHPNYTRTSKYHDIALLQLDKPAKLTDYVRPACLAVSEVPTYIFPQAMGWGLTSLTGETAKILQTGYLAFVSYEKCRNVYKTGIGYRQGILEEFQVCADGGEVIRDTCQGDSGGPLQLENRDYEFNRFPEIVGITSFGKSCGKVPGVYTKVMPYIPWIEKIVWPNS
ncbi:eg:bacr7a4.3 protein-related [Holotrichia oblita]|uniref:Eg:bacr7a4.3 protein-related n=1 Tax=Holotrichia oblita TaxID=644536 RepID=A0ACB9SZK9_HOLOL|nr:eg:bacr7a4.3 protein-related [Holotrichia oblita]